MEFADPMGATTLHHVQIGNRRVDYRVLRSTAAKKLRIRVGPGGVEVVWPEKRNGEDVLAFVERNKRWIHDQLRRVERLRHVRRSKKRPIGEILFRGEPTRVRVEATPTRSRANAVSFVDGAIVVKTGSQSRTPVARSLENWLREEARAEIERQLIVVLGRLRRNPRRVYVMGQRTKWGNCSAGKNLSFNWRLILAPDFVLRYLVTHEAVHLAIPDHSAKFWLTVRSLCPGAEGAKQWLSANGRRLMEPLKISGSGQHSP